MIPTPPSAETVAGMVERLRAGPRFSNGRPVGDQAERGLKDEAADLLESLSSALARVEGERDDARTGWGASMEIAARYGHRLTTAEAQASALQDRVRVLEEGRCFTPAQVEAAAEQSYVGHVTRNKPWPLVPLSEKERWRSSARAALKTIGTLEEDEGHA